MNTSPGQNDDDQRPFGEVLAAYLDSVDSGECPDPQDWLERYPDVAPALREFLAAEDFLSHLAETLGPDLSSSNRSLRSVRAGVPGSAAPADVPRRPLPRLFGQYELLEELGQGGMGVVYKARQTSLNRLVALKMIRDVSWLSEADLIRFRNEAEVAARLDHPHLVPVYDVGQHEGHPYLVMKLVEGSTLAVELARFRDDPRGAARLTAKLARAVHHAHRHGVLHRDLKPTNILLEADGQPRIADFGLARLLQVDSAVTQTGALVGTPSYMAPEQASANLGPPTTAVDVYGLGTILYGLLTGKAPFRAPTSWETLRLVQETEPRAPRSHNPVVPADLETICLKCLEKKPADRYDSALALADDLECWLAGKPIVARPIRAWERLWKWTRRRPAAAALLAVTGLSVISLGAGVVWHNVRLQSALTLVARQQQRAEANSRKARQVVDQMLSDVHDLPLEATQTRQRLLEKSLGFYRGFLAETPNDADVRRETARAFLRLAELYKGSGEVDRAIELLNESISLFEQLREEGPRRDDVRPDLIDAHDALALMYSHSLRRAEALIELGKALAAAKSLAADHPGVADDQRRVAIHHATFANALASEGRSAEAQYHYDASIAVLRAMERNFPDTGPEDEDFARTGLYMGQFLLRLNQLVEAEARLLDAWQRQERFMAVDPQDLSRRWAADEFWGTLGQVSLEAGRFDDAEQALLRGIEFDRDWLSHIADSLVKRRNLPRYLANLAGARLALGQPTEAEQLLNECLALTQHNRSDWPDVPVCAVDLGWARFRLGVFLTYQGREEDASPHFRAARDLFEAECRRSPNAADVRYALAWYFAACPDRAARHPQQAVAEAREAVRLWGGGRFEAWRALALAQLRRGEAASALESLESCRALRPGDSLDGLLAAIALGALGRIDEAQDQYRIASASKSNPHDGLWELLRTEALEQMDQAGMEAQEQNLRPAPDAAVSPTIVPRQ